MKYKVRLIKKFKQKLKQSNLILIVKKRLAEAPGNKELLGKHINSTYYNIILNSLDESNFIKIYNLFNKYKFYFVDDIILRYLEIFDMDEEEVENKTNLLREELGEKYIYIIGSNLFYLDEILDE